MRPALMDAAIEALTKAMELDPGNVFPPYFLGCTNAFYGQHATAVPFFQRAIELDPKHGWSWLGLGMAHLELGHLQEGRWSLEQAAKLEREHPEGPTAGVSGYLGDCLRRAGDLAGARARCLDGLDAVEKSDHMYRDTIRAVCLCVLGRTALEQEDLPAARAAFHQAISHLRGRPPAPSETATSWCKLWQASHARERERSPSRRRSHSSRSGRASISRSSGSAQRT